MAKKEKADETGIEAATEEEAAPPAEAEEGDDLVADIESDDLDVKADDADPAEKPVKEAVRANPKRSTRKPRRPVAWNADDLQTEEGAQRAWDKLSAELADAEVKKYSMKEKFTEIAVIDHKKFGRGYVLIMISPTKVGVLFEDGYRKLACNRV